MLAKITKEDANWLVNVFAPMKGGRVDNSTFQMFLKAYNLMRGTNRTVNCFSCEGRSVAKMASSMYEQYEAEIQAVLTTTKGRKKKS